MSHMKNQIKVFKNSIRKSNRKLSRNQLYDLYLEIVVCKSEEILKVLEIIAGSYYLQESK